MEIVPLRLTFLCMMPGFLVGRDRYLSYGRRLASWGFNALIWEPLNERLPLHVNSHEVRLSFFVTWEQVRMRLPLLLVTKSSCASEQTLSLFVHELLAWAETQNATRASVLHGRFDLSPGAMLVGHSRGAKANCLLAAACPQSRQSRQEQSASTRRAAGDGTLQRVCHYVIRAVVNLDPVDGSPFDDDMSVLPLLGNASASFLHIGSELGNRTVFGPAGFVV